MPYGGYTQAVCFDNTMIEMGCGPQASSPTCGPIHFTPAKSGLGLQAATYDTLPHKPPLSSAQLVV